MSGNRRESLPTHGRGKHRITHRGYSPIFVQGNAGNPTSVVAQPGHAGDGSGVAEGDAARRGRLRPHRGDHPLAHAAKARRETAGRLETRRGAGRDVGAPTRGLAPSQGPVPGAGGEHGRTPQLFDGPIARTGVWGAAPTRSSSALAPVLMLGPGGDFSRTWPDLPPAADPTLRGIRSRSALPPERGDHLRPRDVSTPWAAALTLGALLVAALVIARLM